MYIYKSTQLSWHRNTTNSWTQVSTNKPAGINGSIFTVQEVALELVAITYTATSPWSQEMPTCFLDVLIEWGSTWLWDSLRLVGEDNWIKEAIHDRNCLAVTNLLYMRELYPDLFSAAFVLEWSIGRGKFFGSFPEQLVAAGAYWLVPAQDGPFFSTHSHLSALKNCAFFSTNFQFIFIFKICTT